ncbi:MAG TPA: HlyD family efflux transporter periplasmic adaptor subunit [Gemmatimonadales bacterium]|nr:HlyD family efflux transporter periplasmic adaptor subunit [Gemmatimonadales bacterium]
MSRRFVIALVVLVLVVVGAGILLRPQRAGEPEESREAPVVAPTRVVEQQGEARVVLDSAELARVGIRLAPLARTDRTDELRAAGEVIAEPERTTVIRAPVTGRLTVRESDRWPELGGQVAPGAALGQVSDARPLVAPMGGVVTQVGARPGEIVTEGQTLLELADRSRPVVRLTWPGAGAPPRAVRLATDSSSRVQADLIGPAPEADPVTRQAVYLYRARHAWPGAVPGTLVDADIPQGRATTGVLVPDRAVVQWDGLAWVYLQRAPGRYVRVRVPTDHPTPRGWIAGPPLAPGDTVVVTGAEELLSEEFRARVTVGDESGE